MKKYKKTYKNNIYILIPYFCCENLNVVASNQDYVSDAFISMMNINSKYECNNEVVKDFKRIFVGKKKIACLEDEYDGDVVDTEEVYMFLTVHEATGLVLLTLMNLETSFSPTQIQDQVVSNNLSILDENSKFIDIDTYMKQNYKFTRCGDAKTLLSLSNKPKEVLEFEYMLASEAYNSTNIDYILESQQIAQKGYQNFSQYDFYEIYASNKTIVYILKTFNSSGIDNIKYEVPILFIIELIMFQNSSVLRTNKRIVDTLSLDGDAQLSYIEQLYIEFGKTIKFWNKDVFKYPTSQILADKINDAFETEKLLDDYYKNQKFLEHIVSLRDVQNSNKESKILNKIVLVLTVLQVIPVVISLSDMIVQGSGTTFFSTYWYILGVSSLLILLLIALLENKKNKTKKSNLNK